MNTTQKVKFAIVLVVVIAVGFAWLSLSARNDAKLSKVSDCVVATAKAQGYAGNAYGPEAWQLFSESCAQ